MQLRLILALGVALLSALCGRALAEGVRQRAKVLSEVSDGLRRLRVRMTGMFEPVHHALAQSGCPLFEAVAEGMRDGDSAGVAWKRLLKPPARRAAGIDCLLEADRRALTRLFEGLGQSGREEQELLLAAASESVDALKDAARARLGEADRLYVKLGLLVGIMLALIVL